MFIPSILKSVQSFTISFNGTSALTKDQTISAVNLNNSIIICNGFFSVDGFTARLAFTSTTNVRATRNNPDGLSNPFDVNFTVLEFYGGSLRQNVANFIINSNTAHGLTLGSKAFVVNAGWNNNYAPSLGGIGDPGDINALAGLSGANVVVERGSFVGFLSVYLVDPR